MGGMGWRGESEGGGPREVNAKGGSSSGDGKTLYGGWKRVSWNVVSRWGGVEGVKGGGGFDDSTETLEFGGLSADEVPLIREKTRSPQKRRFSRTHPPPLRRLIIFKVITARNAVDSIIVDDNPLPTRQCVYPLE